MQFAEALLTSAHHRARGETCLWQRDHEKAVADFSAAIRLGTEHSSDYYKRGIAYFYGGNHQQAAEDFGIVIRLRPTWDFGYSWHGRAYERLGHYDLAISDFDHAISLRPNFSAWHFDRVCAYWEKKEYGRVIAGFKALERRRLMPIAPAYANGLRTL